MMYEDFAQSSKAEKDATWAASHHQKLLLLASNYISARGPVGINHSVEKPSPQSNIPKHIFNTWRYLLKV